MSENQAVYPIATMCRVLGVSPSGYYGWVKRRPSRRSRADAALIAMTIGQPAVATPSGGAKMNAERRLGCNPIGCAPASRPITSHQAPAALMTTGLRQVVADDATVAQIRQALAPYR